MSKRVAIAGGGLAGLTCAKYLVDAGYEVELFEGLPFLGGRASTYRDDDGEWVEQGLHLFLGVYSEFKQLLREIGQVPDQVIYRMDQLRFQDPEGPEALFGLNPISSPFKTALSVLGQNDYLNWLDKLSLLPTIAPGLFDFDYLRREHDDETVSGWWERMSGSPQVMERFLRPFCRAIQFSEPEEFSAFNFLGWIHHLAYDLPNAFACGYRGPREETIFEPLARYLSARGARIHTRMKLREVLYGGEPSHITGFMFEQQHLVRADAYVLAVPPWALADVLPLELQEQQFFSDVLDLPVAPAISVQLWFDRPCIRHKDYTLVARVPTPVYLDQSQRDFPDAQGSRLSVIVSPADEWLDRSDAFLIRLAIGSLGMVEPGLLEAGLRKSVVLRHRQHLIRPLPGAMSARPAQSTPIENLFLAGDWTQQPFFGSQEGAVRGGKAAACALIRKLSPQLRVAWLDAAERAALRG